mgnify:FL=1
MQAQGRATKPFSLADLELLEVKNSCVDQGRLIMELHSLREDNRRLWRHSTSRTDVKIILLGISFTRKNLADKERIHVESSTPIHRPSG